MVLMEGQDPGGVEALFMPLVPRRRLQHVTLQTA